MVYLTINSPQNCIFPLRLNIAFSSKPNWNLILISYTCSRGQTTPVWRFWTPKPRSPDPVPCVTSHKINFATLSTQGSILTIFGLLSPNMDSESTNDQRKSIFEFFSTFKAFFLHIVSKTHFLISFQNWLKESSPWVHLDFPWSSILHTDHENSTYNKDPYRFHGLQWPQMQELFLDVSIHPNTSIMHRIIIINQYTNKIHPIELSTLNTGLNPYEREFPLPWFLGV